MEELEQRSLEFYNNHRHKIFFFWLFLLPTTVLVGIVNFLLEFYPIGFFFYPLIVLWIITGIYQLAFEFGWCVKRKGMNGQATKRKTNIPDERTSLRSITISTEVIKN